VTGGGIQPEDNAYITKVIVMELSSWNYSVTNSEGEARYSVIGRIYHPDLVSTDKYSVRLQVRDNNIAEILVEQEMDYESMSDIDEFFAVMLFRLVSLIPLPILEHPVVEGPAPVYILSPAAAAQTLPDDNWRDRFLYAAAYAFWTPRIYNSREQSTYFANYGAGISAEVHFLNNMSLEAGAEIASDWVRLSYGANGEFRDYIAAIPLLVKLVLKPSGNFMLEPYGGVNINISLLGTVRPPLFSVLGGFQYGVKTWQGVLFVDPRFALDIGDSTITAGSDNRTYRYSRTIIQISIGFKFAVK
jgi:hypothetical protein